ncbi:MULTISPECIES: SUKH-3 domain-containing protein [unclassified Micromonospora]|uniref:SUKH-3 domain-containing protein n=1 Tax=unclassified Micromonospora TaxID=2617518 RepID=UPI001C5E868F|nr:SUKH-3 domain-containing protein [Micromonospora sp. RL09-050-HVF-A]MBW4704977.1 SUKH-3 domain-containing protein [Micromonospora sp. RL09-050-HVF-A]
MIDRQQAEQLADVWARRDSQRLGHECRATLDEFDLGYVIRSTVDRAVDTDPGDLPTTVVDKETGEVTTWPRVPAAVVQQMYRRSRPTGTPAPRTVDPASLLLREIRRLPTPATVAHLTVEGRTYLGHGVKGDVAVRHHPLVRAYLDELPPGHLVRGGDRHAEMVVVSDVLHEYDHRRAAAGQPPLTMREAESLLLATGMDVFLAREPGDPQAGPAERPCDSCLNFLVHFAVLGWSELAFTRQWQPDRQAAPEPGRFAPEVADALVSAGWRPGFGDDGLAEEAIAETREISPRHPDLTSALNALTRFPGLASGRRGPGRQVWISRFSIDPVHAAYTAATLADFGAVLGVRLFPIGAGHPDTILAVDEHGRVFALDQAGEWFLGDDVDTALTTLLLGLAPPRVRDDGSW